MKLLGDDPERSVELLMIARFNDDPETAHYATATLTEYQRQTEMRMQQSQAILSKQPDNTAERLEYIHSMETYIRSGLLEEYLDRRQIEIGIQQAVSPGRQVLQRLPVHPVLPRNRYHQLPVFPYPLPDRESVLRRCPVPENVLRPPPKLFAWSPPSFERSEGIIRCPAEAG